MCTMPCYVIHIQSKRSPSTRGNTMNATFTIAETYFCVFCYTTQAIHICQTCNDYNLTIVEAQENGYTV